MSWKPSEHVDEQVRGWMRARRWEVTATDYHFDQEIYSWRHQQPGGKSPTLRIARNVLEHNPAFVHEAELLKTWEKRGGKLYYQIRKTLGGVPRRKVLHLDVATLDNNSPEEGYDEVAPEATEPESVAPAEMI